jgi:hypothetical protein
MSPRDTIKFEERRHPRYTYMRHAGLVVNFERSRARMDMRVKGVVEVHQPIRNLCQHHAFILWELEHGALKVMTERKRKRKRKREWTDGRG